MRGEQRVVFAFVGAVSPVLEDIGDNELDVFFVLIVKARSNSIVHIFRCHVVYLAPYLLVGPIGMLLAVESGKIAFLHLLFVDRCFEIDFEPKNVFVGDSLSNGVGM